MNRKTVLIIGVILIVALSALVAVLTGDGEESDLLAFGEVTVQGEDLPFLADPNADVALGMPAPTLEGQNLAGEPVVIEPGGGDVDVIVFLAHWCPHCQAEVPRLQSYVNEEGLPEGVDLHAVVTATDPSRPNFPPGEWLEGEGWTPPVLVDDEDATAGQAYGVSSFPFFVITGPEGEVMARFAGELSEEAIADLFRSLAEV